MKWKILAKSKIIKTEKAEEKYSDSISSGNTSIFTTLDKYNTKVYLINTGWSGGPYGVGARIKLSYTRAMVTAALNGELDVCEYNHNDLFNVDIPKQIKNVPSELLNPRDTWKDKNEYDKQATKLAKMFQDNFEKKYPYMIDSIKLAGPRA